MTTITTSHSERTAGLLDMTAELADDFATRADEHDRENTFPFENWPRMQEAGYLLSYNSEYLRRRNWIQICLMGECTREKVVSLVNALNRVCFRRRTATTNASGMETPTSVPQS